MSDTKPAPPGRGRIFLSAYKPPKPIGEMSGAELDAWASAVADAIAARLGQANEGPAPADAQDVPGGPPAEERTPGSG